MVRVYSNHAYYQYLTKYSPSFLRRHEQLQYWQIGRGSGFERLLKKFATDHLGTEEMISMTYYTPTWVIKLSNRLMWCGTMYYWLYCNHLLGEQARIWNVAERNNPSEQYTMNTQPLKYERIYAIDKSRHHLQI